MLIIFIYLKETYLIFGTLDHTREHNVHQCTEEEKKNTTETQNFVLLERPTQTPNSDIHVLLAPFISSHVCCSILPSSVLTEMSFYSTFPI